MKGAAVATPLELVIAVVVVALLSVKVPLGPVEGAVNVTTAPTTGKLVVVSQTVADSAVPKFVLTVALCPSPAVDVNVVGNSVFVTLRRAVDCVDSAEAMML